MRTGMLVTMFAAVSLTAFPAQAQFAIADHPRVNPADFVVTKFAGSAETVNVTDKIVIQYVKKQKLDTFTSFCTPAGTQYAVVNTPRYRVI